MIVKVAFIYSGLSRTIIDSIKTLNNKLNNKEIQYDIYVYTEINEIDTSYLHKKFNINDLYLLDNVKSILVDKSASVNLQPDPTIYKSEKEINAYYQWYKINRVYSIIDKNIDYDYIIRIRSDLFILENLDTILLDINNIANNIANIANNANNTIYIPIGNNIYDSRHKINERSDNNDICIDSINDQFAIGTPYVMNIYCNIINEIDEYIKNSNSIETCSEIMLAQHLKKYNIHVERFKLDYKLVLSLCNTIGITGNSGAGKSTLTHLIENIFKFDKKIILETDRYHKWERGHPEWNTKTHLNPQSNYLEKLHEDTFNLKLGNDIYAVDYDHGTGKFTPLEKVESKENIVICGLHTLYNNNLRDIIDLKIFIDTQESLQYYWKIKRDVIERGYNIEKVLKSIQSRKEDYLHYIQPQKEYSDIIIHYYADNIVDIVNIDNINIINNIAENNYKEKQPPNILLKILIKYNIFDLLKDNLNKFADYITVTSNIYDNNFITLNINNDITQKEIYGYLSSLGINFLNNEDIYDGYNGVIQLIIALILYKS